MNNYAVIMAGGSGTRLWPLSRKLAPKQFHQLTSSNTLLQETYNRMRLVLPNDHIFISTTPQYVKKIKKQLPLIPSRNFIVEPMARNTTAAHGFIAFHFQKINPNAIVATVPSDHVIQNNDVFVNVTKAAFAAITEHPDHIATLGIKPDKADTGLGHLKMGQLKGIFNNEKAYLISKFCEKPELRLALKYFRSGEYLWSSANYVFKASELLTWIKKYRPESYNTLENINLLLGQKSSESIKEKIASLYQNIESEQLANSVVEQPDFGKALVIPADMGWNDVGNWDALHEILSNPENSLISKGNHIDYDSQKCLVYGNKKLIATLGLKDVVVVDTPDAILIADKSRVQDIKKLVEKIDAKYL